MLLESRITKLVKRVKLVERLREDLKGSEIRYSQMREILELKYIGHEGNIETQEKKAVSSATFWRRVRELLRLAKKYFSEIEHR